MRVVEFYCDKCNSLITGPIYKGEFFRVDREDEEQIFDRNWWFADIMGKAHLCGSCVDDLVKLIVPKTNLHEIETEPLPFEEIPNADPDDVPVVNLDFCEELAEAIAEDIEEINKEVAGEPEKVKPVKNMKKKSSSKVPTDYGKLAALLNAGWKTADIMVEFGWSSYQTVGNNKAKLTCVNGKWEVPDELKR